MDKLIFSAKETAAYLGVSRDSVYDLCRAGKVPGFRVGGQWRFSKSELDAWVIRESRKTLRADPDPATARGMGEAVMANLAEHSHGR
jgi:excisionase family DNA binding protein